MKKSKPVFICERIFIKIIISAMGLCVGNKPLL